MTMNFEEAVGVVDSPVRHAYRKGKQALQGKHRELVDCNDPRRITGSVDLDSALAGQPRHAQKSRWDYGLGYKSRSGVERAIWIEIHPAATSDVKQVIQKFVWLRQWLKSEARQLMKLTETSSPGVPAYIWIATGSVRILRHSPQAKQLSVCGLKIPTRQLALP